MANYAAMLKRQQVLADFGEFALRSENLDDVLTEACRLTGEALGTQRAKVLEIQDGNQWLLLRAGVGWAPEIVGTLRLPMAEHSSETFAISEGKPVIMGDIRQETRFDVPQFMKDAGVVALVNVPIFVPGRKPYGLLQVDAAEPRDFGQDEIEFLRTYATILGPVIDRLHKLQRLQTSEDRLRLIVENARNYGIFVSDPDDRIQEWWPGAANVFGWTAEEVVGQPSSVLFTPEDRDRDVPDQETETAERDGRAPDVRWHQRKDGARVFIEGSTIALRDAEQHLRGYLKIGQDVTERRRAEEALRDNEARIRQFAEASPAILWAREAETLQLYVLSPAFKEIFGPVQEEALAGNDFRRWLEFVEPEHRSEVVSCMRRMREGERVTFEYRIRRPVDGTTRWIRDTGFPIQDAQGQVYRLGGVGQDITDLKAAEAALRHSEQRLRTLVEGVPQLVWRAAAGGYWTWASPQWTAYTGQPEEESHGLGWLAALHPDDRADAEAGWANASAGGPLTMETRIYNAAENRYRWFATRATPVQDADGTTVEWLGTSTDIHDLRELQEQQHVLVGELQHRTQNLMGVVRSMVDSTLRSSTDRADFQTRIHDRLEALGRVQLLLSHLHKGERVTFDGLIRSELKAIGASLGNANKVTLEGPIGIELRSSTVQIFAMALHELATNAVKYGALKQPSGHLAVTWRLDANGENDRPSLHVDWHESGVTLPPDSAPQGKGQGRQLIERALPYQLGASTTYVMGPDGVRCSIAVPIPAQREADGTAEHASPAS